jgi:hypothetical protein
MRSLVFRRGHKYFQHLSRALTGAAGLVGAAEKADIGKTHDVFGDSLAGMLSWAQTWNWLFVPGAIFLAALLRLAMRWIGDPKKWGVVHDVLDQFRDEVFKTPNDDVAHEHRVTLFKKKDFHVCRRDWWWKGWLVPVERSGHTSQRTDVYFLAPDNAEHAEGVAGKTWARKGKPIYVKDLPDLSSNPTEADFVEYSRRSFMSLEEVRRRVPRARSLYGFAVEVAGQKWGVIVVDSRLPSMKEREIKKHYKMVARFLGKTLEAI